MTPLPVIALLLTIGLRPISIFPVLLLQVPPVSRIFPFIPFVPIAVLTIVIPLDAISVMVVVVSGGAYGYWREQGRT